MRHVAHPLQSSRMPSNFGASIQRSIQRTPRPIDRATVNYVFISRAAAIAGGMKPLTRYTKKRFMREHLSHRLTLLRTFRERTTNGYSFTGKGDIYRCLKDSNLMAVRLLLDFLGLKGEYYRGRWRLTESPRRTGIKFEDDVKVDQFIGRLLKPSDVPRGSRTVLAGVYRRADKELAHLTVKFNERFNEPNALIEAATAVEQLIQRFVYKGGPLPPIDV